MTDTQLVTNQAQDYAQTTTPTRHAVDTNQAMCINRTDKHVADNKWQDYDKDRHTVDNKPGKIMHAQIEQETKQESIYYSEWGESGEDAREQHKTILSRLQTSMKVSSQL